MANRNPDRTRTSSEPSTNCKRNQTRYPEPGSDPPPLAGVFVKRRSTSKGLCVRAEPINVVAILGTIFQIFKIHLTDCAGEPLYSFHCTVETTKGAKFKRCTVYPFIEGDIWVSIRLSCFRDPWRFKLQASAN